MSFPVVPPHTMATLILTAIVLGCLALGVRLFTVEAAETWIAGAMRASAALVVASAGIRTNGLGLPGYALGHFRLNNGRRARLALTTRSSVAYVPFDRRAALLLSVDQGEKFVAALRNAATT